VSLLSIRIVGWCRKIDADNQEIRQVLLLSVLIIRRMGVEKTMDVEDVLTVAITAMVNRKALEEWELEMTYLRQRRYTVHLKTDYDLPSLTNEMYLTKSNHDADHPSITVNSENGNAIVCVWVSDMPNPSSI